MSNSLVRVILACYTWTTFRRRRVLLFPIFFWEDIFMATNQLTPEQQAAFDQFVSDAQEAQQAHKDKQAADTELTSAQLAQQSTTAMDIADHQKALTSAQAFIDLMVPPNPSPPAGATSAGKK